MRSIFWIVCCSVCMLTVVAQQQSSGGDEVVAVRKKDLPPDLVEKIQAQQKVEDLQKKIETYGKWVGLGKEVGSAVNESLSALTTQAEKFSKTGVGKFTMFIVAWKVLGKDFMGFIIGVPLLILATSIFLWSYRKTCLPYRVLTKVNADKSKEYTILNQEDMRDEYLRLHLLGMRWAHIVVFLAFVLIVSWSII